MEIWEQGEIKFRGYTLRDNDWREYPLRRLSILGNLEEAGLARLESEEPMTDWEYNQINTHLDAVQKEMKEVISFYVAPVAYRWWVSDEGRRMI